MHSARTSFIKLYGSGSMMSQGGDPGVRILEEDEIREAGHSFDKGFAGS
ncbi:hypothetical protein GRF59_03430 [Paenibacillus sp. HJL G12]|uniref:Uncharacterized protein n=1 Tax=Paenibacillus dendrobii TaxID=2691084 RepID=A0A7X3IEY8_9BACL|nr:hypothetical protein [Paenibacillus dendrobii]